MPQVNGQPTQPEIAEQMKFDYQHLDVTQRIDVTTNIRFLRGLLERCGDLFHGESDANDFLTDGVPAMPIGTRVFWADPDNDISSGAGVVVGIDDYDRVFDVEKDDGGRVQGLRNELSEAEVPPQTPSALSQQEAGQHMSSSFRLLWEGTKHDKTEMVVTITSHYSDVSDGPGECIHTAEKIACDFADKFMRRPETVDGSDSSDQANSKWEARIHAAASVHIPTQDVWLYRDEEDKWVDEDGPREHPNIAGIHIIDWSNRYDALLPDAAVACAVGDLTYPEGHLATIVSVHMGNDPEEMVKTVVMDMEKYIQSGDPEDVYILSDERTPPMLPAESDTQDTGHSASENQRLLSND
jgi:hypothetical protein